MHTSHFNINFKLLQSVFCSEEIILQTPIWFLNLFLQNQLIHPITKMQKRNYTLFINPGFFEITVLKKVRGKVLKEVDRIKIHCPRAFYLPKPWGINIYFYLGCTKPQPCLCSAPLKVENYEWVPPKKRSFKREYKCSWHWNITHPIFGSPKGRAVMPAPLHIQSTFALTPFCSTVAPQGVSFSFELKKEHLTPEYSNVPHPRGASGSSSAPKYMWCTSEVTFLHSSSVVIHEQSWPLVTKWGECPASPASKKASLLIFLHQNEGCKLVTINGRCNSVTSRLYYSSVLAYPFLQV